MMRGGDEDLLSIATVQGQIGSASSQPDLVESIPVHGRGKGAFFKVSSNSNHSTIPWSRRGW